MSRVSSSKVVIPDGTKVVIANGVANVKGKIGELNVNVIPGVIYNIENNVISAAGSEACYVGTAMRLIGNAVSGVNKLFDRKIEIHDANVRAKLDGKNLVLNVGYSHDVTVAVPSEIAAVEIDTSNKRYVVLTIKSMSKQSIGDFIDNIRSIKKSRPYGDFCIKIVGQPFYLKKPRGK